jgi:hypothetical protein
MAERPLYPSGAEIAAQAYDMFDAWSRSRGDIDHLTLLEQINVYYKEHAAPKQPGET